MVLLKDYFPQYNLFKEYSEGVFLPAYYTQWVIPPRLYQETSVIGYEKYQKHYY